MATPTESSRNQRSRFISYLLLALAVLACLLPFSGKAFNVDDTLFVYLAQQITKHPLDPFGFKINWFVSAILPALAAVWGTYRLAQRFTSSPLLAAAATLLTPAFLVSANSVMCDTMMTALWLWAIIFWIEGFEPQKPRYLAISALLITLCALTKYFGIALIPLLAAYSLARQRRVGSWAWYLLAPILVLTGYQRWTKAVYGLRMITFAAHVPRAFDKGGTLQSWPSR
jgi:hypothetical protein